VRCLRQSRWLRPPTTWTRPRRPRRPPERETKPAPSVLSPGADVAGAGPVPARTRLSQTDAVSVSRHKRPGRAIRPAGRGQRCALRRIVNLDAVVEAHACGADERLGRLVVHGRERRNVVEQRFQQRRLKLRQIRCARTHTFATHAHRRMCARCSAEGVREYSASDCRRQATGAREHRGRAVQCSEVQCSPTYLPGSSRR
jgi:hypothetical protein